MIFKGNDEFVGTIEIIPIHIKIPSIMFNKFVKNIYILRTMKTVYSTYIEKKNMF